MQKFQDTALVLSFATILAGASLYAVARTDLGDVSTGWTNGTYQRGYESRFDTSVPGQRLAKNAWSSVRWGLLREASNGAVVGRNGWLFTAEEFQEPPETRDFKKELERVSRALSERGIALVPVIVPDKARMHANVLPRQRALPYQQRYARVLMFIRDAGLPDVDLRDALDFDHSFMRQDTHWSPEGARRSAEAVANAINADLPTVSVKTESLGYAAFDGDLLTFVSTGVFRPWVGPAQAKIERFETTVETDAGLFGDSAAPVALVGTSYSAVPSFHFAGFLKSALSADVVNAAVIGQGPFKPMDDFLKDLGSFTSPPSVVIWEIPERFLSTME